MVWKDLYVVADGWTDGSSLLETLRSLFFEEDGTPLFVPLGFGVVCLPSNDGVRVLVVMERRSS